VSSAADFILFQFRDNLLVFGEALTVVGGVATFDLPAFCFDLFLS
jgi:hypothetical protein